MWEIGVPLPGKFIIDIEFLDLKTTCPKVCKCIIYPCGTDSEIKIIGT